MLQWRLCSSAPILGATHNENAGLVVFPETLRMPTAEVMSATDTKGPAARGLDARGLAAAVVVGTLGALTIMVVPGFVMLVGGQSSLDDDQLGYVASWDINASAAAIGLATFLIARWSWRQLAAIGLTLIVVGSLLTAANHTYATIVAARICAGLGEGLAIAVSFAALGSAVNPDRAFGIYLVVGLTASAAILAALPALESQFGSPAVFATMAAISALSMALLPWLPKGADTLTAQGQGATPIAKHLAVGGLVGVFLYFTAQGAVWSYFERIGAASGIAPGVIGEAMGLSSFAGVGGAVAAVALVSPCGRRWPLVASGVISLVSFGLLHGHVTGASLITAGILFNFAWNMAQPLLSGICSDADCRGRIVVAMGCIQTVGFGLGPALTATLLRERDFGPSLWVSAAVLVLSLIVVVNAIRAHAASQPAAA
jgi:MFS transporter, DHA1 family, inner membrane transport protein